MAGAAAMIRGRLEEDDPLQAETEFIALWNAGTEIAALAQRLSIPKGTVQSRAHRLQQRVLIQPRPRGGAYPSQPALARQERAPAQAPAPAPARVHIEQWTVRLSTALIERIKAEAVAAQKPPSPILEELAWKALNDQSPSRP
jgi:DNA-binding transcriptional MocR family regulator